MSRRVLVTGGTRGIGAALVQALLARGDRVVATGRTGSSVGEAASRWPTVDWRVLDLAVPVDWAAWLQPSGGERFDLVILNAGVQLLRDFTGAGDEPVVGIDEELRINLAAPMAMALALPTALAPRASVVFVTSGLALAPKRSSPVYCASKAGLRSFTKSLRAQWAPLGWQVIEALPPLVDTDMTRGRGSRKMSAEDAASQLLAGVDAGRDEIDIGATRLLRVLLRLSPALGERIMRDR
jgi:uncharacterized oxidoreductase